MVFHDILSELISSMFASEGIGIVAIRQEHHFHVHALLKQHIGTPQCRLYACLVAIVEQHDVLGEAVQEVNLMFGESCARISHNILNATLVHGNDIGISLHHIDAVLFGYRLLSLEQAVELVVFVIDIRIGRVDILLVHALGSAVKNSSAECRYLTTYTYPGEYHPTRKTID